MRILAAILVALSTQSALAADVKLADAQYPEGALWQGGHLYYEEMWRNTVRVSDLRRSETLWSTGACGPVNIAPYGEGFVVLCHLTSKLVLISRDGETIGTIDRDSDGREFVHPNGAIADGEGGVYITASGDFDVRAPSEGAVLYLDAAGKLTRIASGIHYANGIAVDRERRRLIVCAHLARELLAYPILEPGRIGEPRVFFSFAANGIVADLPLAGPDGIETDTEGNFIVAEYGAGRLHKIAPDGTWLGAFGDVEPFVTDVAILPGDRAVIVGARDISEPPFWGTVMLREHFSERFKK